MCDTILCACLCVLWLCVTMWALFRGFGREIIDSFSHWSAVNHLTSWKANSGIINFSTLGLMSSQLSFSVRSYKIPLSGAQTLPKNPVFLQRQQILCLCWDKTCVTWCKLGSLRENVTLLSLQLRQRLPFLLNTTTKHYLVHVFMQVLLLLSAYLICLVINCQWEKKQQIFTLEHLKLLSIWHFCLENAIKQLAK